MKVTLRFWWYLKHGRHPLHKNFRNASFEMLVVCKASALTDVADLEADILCTLRSSSANLTGLIETSFTQSLHISNLKVLVIWRISKRINHNQNACSFDKKSNDLQELLTGAIFLWMEIDDSIYIYAYWYMLETRLPRLDASVQTVAARSAYRGYPWIKKKTTKTWHMFCVEKAT